MGYIPTAPEELNICKILHAQRTQALHAVKVIRKKKILKRNAARLKISKIVL